jgi:hypothetical protein
VWPNHRARGRWSKALVVGSLGLLTASCTLSGLSYVSHTDAAQESVYYAIPSSWQRFNVEQVFRSADPKASVATLDQVEQSLWGNIVVGRHMTSLAAASQGFGSTFPFGIVKAQELTPQEQDTFSLATLRTLILQQDPFNPSSSLYHFTVLSYTTFVRKGGFRGSTMLVKEQVGGAPPIELEQVAEVNPATTWAYVLGIGCTARCFAANQAQIATVINSFGVEATQ